MRDLLGGLRHPRARGYEKAYPQGYSPHQAYNEALDDATAALRNPTDEQVEQGAKELAARMELWPTQTVDADWTALTPADRADWITLTREAWATAAGGHDD